MIKIALSIVAIGGFLIALPANAQKSEDSIPTKQDTKLAAQAIKKLGLCGVYKASGGLYDSLTFKDNGEASVDTSLGGFPVPYWFKNQTVYIRTDKAMFELKPSEDGNTLVGQDRWNKGESYTRKTKQSCSFANIDKKTLRHELCYAHGVSLQAQGKTEAALSVYESCCKIQDPLSCNKQGFILQLLKKKRDRAVELYKKSCNLGYGGGCANHAGVLKGQGKTAEAKAMYEKACDMKFMDACVRLIDFD